MAKNTKIEWADNTFNPWIGCTKVSPACDHCYAEKERASTALGVKWGANMPRHRTSESNWKTPVRWNAAAKHRGVRESVFCASLGDWADNAIPAQWRFDLADVIIKTTSLDWLLLTKRIGNAAAMLAEMFPTGIPSNVWVGATICNQEEADRDIPKLLAVPAAKRFLSMEPLLGPVDLTDVPVGGGGGRWEGDEIITGNVLHRAVSSDPSVHWVIVGGESGPHARPMHPDWVRSLRDQCQAAGVPFMFKQWGEWMPEAAMTLDQRMRDCGQFECLFTKLDGSTHWIDPDDRTPYDASDVRMVKIGKKSAGRLLDSRTWDEVPS